MKAFGLLRNSATSIWSSDTPWRCVRCAARYSVSPSRTLYSSMLPAGAALGAGAAARCIGAAGAAAGRGVGAGAAARGGAGGVTGAIGAAAIGGDAGAGVVVAPGAAEITGAAGAAACTGGATRDCGGSSSRVYSRTSRPDDQVSSRITSTNGSCTARSLVMRR